MLERCLDRFEDLRRPGAAAMDLCWVAQGVFDGYFEQRLSPWDVAAGGLIVQEAGGIVSNWQLDLNDWISDGNILAGNSQVHEVLGPYNKRVLGASTSCTFRPKDPKIPKNN